MRSLRSAAGCGHSSAAQAPRGCPASRPGEVRSVSVERRSSLAPHPPWLWRRSSVPDHLLLRSAARAMRTVCCSCLSMARSHRSRRRRAAPELWNCPLGSGINSQHSGKHPKITISRGENARVWILVVVVVACVCAVVFVSSVVWCVASTIRGALSPGWLGPRGVTMRAIPTTQLAGLEESPRSPQETAAGPQTEGRRGIGNGIEVEPRPPKLGCRAELSFDCDCDCETDIRGTWCLGFKMTTARAHKCNNHSNG